MTLATSRPLHHAVRTMLIVALATRFCRQVLYPTLSDYDIRYYVMELLKACGGGGGGGGRGLARVLVRHRTGNCTEDCAPARPGHPCSRADPAALRPHQTVHSCSPPGARLLPLQRHHAP